MKVQLNAPAVLALAGLGVAALLAWKGPKLAAAAWNGVKGAADAVNPLNHDNVFAGGVNAVGAAIVTEPDGAGKNADGSWSLGGWLRDVTSNDDERIRDMLKGSEPARFTGGVDPAGSW